MVIRAEHREKFSVIDNNIFRNPNLSLKAKGLLSVMLSLPDDWDFSKKGLVAICKENETAIDTAIKELQEQGYLKIHKQYPNQSTGGKIKYIYTIYEQPTEKQEIEFQKVENLPLENHPQLNTNILNTNNIYCPSGDEQGRKQLSKEDIESQVVSDFEKIWENYPRKEGKDTAYKHYNAWLKGRNFAGVKEKLTNKEMYFAVQIYAYECDRDNKDKQYIQMGSTFFDETIFEKVKRYKKYPVEWEEKIREWRIKTGNR